MQAMILILFMIIGLPAFSQTEQFPSVDFELKAATFNCELASMVAGELSSSSHEQINQLIQSSEKVIKQNISIHKDEKILKEILSILEDLKRRENETKFQQFREEFCLKGSHFLKKFSQKIISGSVNLNMSLALPIRWVTSASSR